MVSLKIDGKEVAVEEGSTLLEAAETLGIRIPTLCHHRSLAPYGACRLCLVELEGPKPSLQASCVYPVQEGLVVKTDTERVLRTRKMMMELLLARCSEIEPIRQLARELGVEGTRFPKKQEDCILCGLCVRVCQERMGVGAIDFVGRGTEKLIAPAYDRHSERCIVCGACKVVCPIETVDLTRVTAKEPRPITAAFDLGLSPRPSIYIPYPQAVPRAAVIDAATCMHLRGQPGDLCRACEAFCDAKAIDFTQKEETRDIDVGAVILAPGFELFDPELVQEYGYGRYPNVVSSLQFERILSASGPFEGRVLRPSNLEPPKKLAFIQCVGSRETNGRNYCSSVCCMYATKHALIGMEHEKDLECTIFFIDMRAFGKGFDAYYERAVEAGVRYVRCKPSAIHEDHATHNLRLVYQDEGKDLVTEEFDLVVLSCGLAPSAGVQQLAEQFGVELDEHGFCATDGFSPVETSAPGVFACGPFTEPKDIPETIMQACGAASKAMALLNKERGSLITHTEYPPEKDVSGQEPRIGVFVCHCGKNIGGVANVPSIVEYAKTLPDVVHAEDNLYTCSVDTQLRIRQMIEEHDLNRVVVSSCSPRTHEALFRDTCRKGGLNEYLFEMANIRDQNTWVHMHEPEKATEKAKDLTRMAVAKARLLEPLSRIKVAVNHDALVIGGGMAGMTAALDLAGQGFEVHLVEKEDRLGGNLRNVHYQLAGTDPQKHLDHTIAEVRGHPKIDLHLKSRLTEINGYYGNFESKITNGTNGSEPATVQHGVVILATGAEERKPTEYLYGEEAGVLTQNELENALANGDPSVKDLRSVVMIQCVGSREPERPWCSRICCSHAVKNSLKLKELSPETEVYVLYRDIRTYGTREKYFGQARQAGVRFLRYDTDRKPRVEKVGETFQVTTYDRMLNREIRLEPDLVVLSTGIIPRDDADELAKMLKISQSQEKFFLEAHMKLRPVDFATEGVFMCGLAHWPKAVDESIAQAGAAASRAATILSQDELDLEGAVSTVYDPNCDGCAYCVGPCPYNAITLIEYMSDGTVKKTVEVNESLCKGCGSCQATCPKQGIFVKHFRLEQIEAMVNAALQN
ncbi:MAG: FAD-dependent oxidoreductase [bacterium]|nr:FAD-dependent oxidoreductase [bacterium]